MSVLARTGNQFRRNSLLTVKCLSSHLTNFHSGKHGRNKTNQAVHTTNGVSTMSGWMQPSAERVDDIVKNGWVQYSKELWSFRWFTAWCARAEIFLYGHWDGCLFVSVGLMDVHQLLHVTSPITCWLASRARRALGARQHVIGLTRYNRWRQWPVNLIGSLTFLFLFFLIIIHFP